MMKRNALAMEVKKLELQKELLELNTIAMQKALFNLDSVSADEELSTQQGLSALDALSKLEGLPSVKEEGNTEGSDSEDMYTLEGLSKLNGFSKVVAESAQPRESNVTLHERVESEIEPTQEMASELSDGEDTVARIGVHCIDADPSHDDLHVVAAR